MKTALIIVSAICVIALAMLGALISRGAPEKSFSTKIDTIVIEKPSKPVIIKGKAKVKILRDTIIERAPFIARLDTIIEKDTVYASYKFPEDTISLVVKKKPDSLIYRTVTIEIEKPRAWHEIPVYTGIGAVIGTALGILIKK